MKTRKYLIGAVAIGALLFATAFQPIPSARAEEVNIGLLVGFTGDMAPWSPALNNAAILAVEEVNAAGGILGKKVKMWSEDNESTVEGGIRGARKLVNINNVSAIIGPESDPIVALLKFAKDNQVPIISTSGGTQALDKAGGTGRFIYRTNASDSFLGVVTAKLTLDELGQKEVAVLVENLEGTVSAADTFIRNYERFGGTITKKIVLSPGQSTYLSELRELSLSKPKLVLLATGQVTGVTILKQAFQRGYKWDWWVTTDLQNPDFVASVGVEIAKGIMSQVSGQRDGAPSWQRFSDRYAARFGEKPEAGFYQAETYDAVIIAALAAEAAKDSSGAAIDAQLTNVANPPGVKVLSFEEGVRALRKGEDIDYVGASGSVDFNKYGNVSIPATRLLKVNESGEWETIKVIDSSMFPPS